MTFCRRKKSNAAVLGFLGVFVRRWDNVSLGISSSKWIQRRAFVLHAYNRPCLKFHKGYRLQRRYFAIVRFILSYFMIKAQATKAVVFDKRRMAPLPFALVSIEMGAKSKPRFI